MSLRRIYKHFKNDGIDGLIYRYINILGIKTHYLNIREKNKYDLDQRIINLSNSRVLSGYYKDIYLSGRSDWGVNNFSSKLLGFYEKFYGRWKMVDDEWTKTLWDELDCIDTKELTKI